MAVVYRIDGFAGIHMLNFHNTRVTMLETYNIQ